MQWLGRRLVNLLVGGFALMGFCLVPLGEHTALGHVAALGSTDAARRLAAGLVTGAQAVAAEFARVRAAPPRGEDRDPAARAPRPTPPALPPPALPEATERAPASPANAAAAPQSSPLETPLLLPQTPAESGAPLCLPWPEG